MGCWALHLRRTNQQSANEKTISHIDLPSFLNQHRTLARGTMARSPFSNSTSSTRNAGFGFHGLQLGRQGRDFAHATKMRRANRPQVRPFREAQLLGFFSAAIRACFW